MIILQRFLFRESNFKTNFLCLLDRAIVKFLMKYPPVTSLQKDLKII